MFDCVSQLPERLRPTTTPRRELGPGVRVQLIHQALPPTSAPYRREHPEDASVLVLHVLERAHARGLGIRAAIAGGLSLLGVALWSSAALPSGAAFTALAGAVLGLALALSVLPPLVNRVTITLDEHVLELRQGPLSLQPARHLPVDQLREIRCIHMVRGHRPDGDPVSSYAVVAHLGGQHFVELLTDLPKPSEALAIAETLAAQLERAQRG